MTAYDVADLKYTYPGDKYSPDLQEFLQHGELTELCEAILDRKLDDRPKLLARALSLIPPTAMLSVMYLRMFPQPTTVTEVVMKEPRKPNG